MKIPIKPNKIKGQTHFCPFAPFSLFSPKTTYKSPAILETYATERGCSIRRAVHFLAAALVHGAQVPSRAHLAPDVWKFTGE